MSDFVSRRNAFRSAGLGALGLALSSVAGGAEAEMGETGEMASAPGKCALPELPYSYDGLEPAVSAELLRIHHDRHHAGYVAGLNSTLDRLAEARAAGDMSAIRSLSRDLAFHGSGHVLHSLYWRSMTPGGSSPPSGRLAAAVERDFGSYDAFRAQFTAAAGAVEGSGWALLAWEPMGGRLVVLQVENHQNLTIWGALPLLVCDVWEHAYYLQYQNRRADYVEAFRRLVDWPGAEERFGNAVG